MSAFAHVRRCTCMRMPGCRCICARIRLHLCLLRPRCLCMLAPSASPLWARRQHALGVPWVLVGWAVSTTRQPLVLSASGVSTLRRHKLSGKACRQCTPGAISTLRAWSVHSRPAVSTLQTRRQYTPGVVSTRQPRRQYTPGRAQYTPGAPSVHSRRTISGRAISTLRAPSVPPHQPSVHSARRQYTPGLAQYTPGPQSVHSGRAISTLWAPSVPPHQPPVCRCF